MKWKLGNSKKKGCITDRQTVGDRNGTDEGIGYDRQREDGAKG